jgi:serine/threonine-protein kinase HipA
MRRIQILLGNTKILIGMLFFNISNNKETCSFTYEESWLKNPKAFSIDPNALPLRPEPHFHDGTNNSPFFPVICDASPSGWAMQIMQRDKANIKTSKTNHKLTAMDYLLWMDDRYRPGALRFCDENGAIVSNHEAPSLPIVFSMSTLMKAIKAIEYKEETASELSYLREKATSLCGLRPKATIYGEDGSLWLAKFPSGSDTRSYAMGEVLANRLAQMAGIQVPEARLIDVDGDKIALFRRFDRTPTGRKHFISGYTMIGGNRDEEHTYTEMTDALRRYGNNPDRDLHELWRRLVFNILITNVDDHLNNHGFLHIEHGKWILSPAYDINPFPDRERVLKTWPSEDTGPDATLDNALQAARYFNLSEAHAMDIIRQVHEATSQWKKVGLELGLHKNNLEEIRNAFKHCETKEAAKISYRSQGSR